MPPYAVFEILSPSNRPAEMAASSSFYDKYGVQEYYIYDPDKGTLKGWLRAGDHLEAVANMAGFVSPGLGIRFEPGEGPDNLKIFKPDGTPIQTYVQLADDLEAAKHRLDDERAAKEAERKRARNATPRDFARSASNQNEISFTASAVHFVMRLGYNTNGLAHHRLLDAIDLLADEGYQSIAITLDASALDPYEDPQVLSRQVSDVKRASIATAWRG